MSFDPALDRYEEILVRLEAIGQGLSGIASVWRNHGPAQTGLLGVPRPAFLLYDGGGAKLTQDVKRFKSQKMPPTIWCMRPQIMILLENRDAVDNLYVDAAYSPIGPDLSGWKEKVNAAVTNDDVLIDLVTSDGTHFLSSFETDAKVGRTVGAYGAWLLMLYEFYYPYFPPR